MFLSGTVRLCACVHACVGGVMRSSFVCVCENNLWGSSVSWSWMEQVHQCRCLVLTDTQHRMSVAMISTDCSVTISPEEDQDLYQTTNDRCFAPGPGETRNVLSAAAPARTQKVQRQSQSNAAEREDKIKRDRHHRSWHRHVTCPDLERQEFYTQFIQCYLMIDWLDNYLNTLNNREEKKPFWQEETCNSILMIVICNTEDNNTISIGNAVIMCYYVLLVVNCPRNKNNDNTSKEIKCVSAIGWLLWIHVVVAHLDPAAPDRDTCRVKTQTMGK